jgi:hypothetical protein
MIGLYSSVSPPFSSSSSFRYFALSISFHSDHHPCFLDIDSEIMFEDTTNNMLPPCRRQFQLHDPAIVGKYSSILQQQLMYHKIPEKIATLQQSISKGQWIDQDRTSYEKIDRLIMEAMLHAERKSSKKFTGTFAWSPELIQSVQQE